MDNPLYIINTHLDGSFLESTRNVSSIQSWDNFTRRPRIFQTLKNLCLIKENTTPFEFLHELIETEKIDPVKKTYKYLVNIVKTFSFEPKGKKSSFEPPQDQISSQLNEKTDFKVTGVAILEMLDLN